MFFSSPVMVKYSDRSKRENGFALLIDLKKIIFYSLNFIQVYHEF